MWPSRGRISASSTMIRRLNRPAAPSQFNPNNIYPHAMLVAALALNDNDVEARDALQRYLALPKAVRTVAAWKAIKAQNTSARSDPRYLEAWTASARRGGRRETRARIERATRHLNRLAQRARLHPRPAQGEVRPAAAVDAQPGPKTQRRAMARKPATIPGLQGRNLSASSNRA
jgi:hypothetical protein